jgi:hypothetical protein
MGDGGVVHGGRVSKGRDQGTGIRDQESAVTICQIVVQCVSWQGQSFDWGECCVDGIKNEVGTLQSWEHFRAQIAKPPWMAFEG